MKHNACMIPEGFEGQQLYRVPAQALRRMRSRPFTRDFIITDLGFFPASRGHGITRPAGVDQWILIFVNSGTGWVEADDTQHQLREHEVLLLPPGRGHSYGASDADPWSIFWFHFEGKGSHALLEWLGDVDPVMLRRAQSPDGMRRQFRSILNGVERGYPDHTLLELSRTLINVLSLLHRNPPHPHRNDAFERMEAVMTRMRADLRQPGSLQDYARTCALSVPQFCHLFKSHTGISPMAYLTELRMQLACEYLDTTDWSVKQIAAELGYADALYFSRAFKKCVGKSPKQYRDAW